MKKIEDLTIRQKLLLQLLLNAKDIITSSDMAAIAKVSSRTVKSEIPYIQVFLEENGAKLIAKRNRGYKIEVVNQQQFQEMKDSLREKSALQSSVRTDKDARIMYICRRLITADDYITMNTLCDEMYISMSTLSHLLPQAYTFCKSFHLQVITNNKGIRVLGEEHHLRIAIVELIEFYAMHISLVNEEFKAWISCTIEDRRIFRNIFFETLMKYGYCVRDNVAHRLVMYIVISYNREKANMPIQFKQEIIDEVKTTKVYPLAEEVYQLIQKQYPDFSVAESEITFLTILILANLDVDITRAYRTIAPFINDMVSACEQSVVDDFHKYKFPDFSVLQNAKCILCQMIFPVVIVKRYNLDGFIRNDYSYQKIFTRNPLCMFLGQVAGHAITKVLHNKITIAELTTLSCFFEASLIKVSYEIKKQRIITTNLISKEFAKVQADRLFDFYHKYIESITPLEVYEAMRLDDTKYDVILVENAIPNEQKQGLFGFNYRYPTTTIQLSHNGKDFSKIYNQILINAYQIEKHIPPVDMIHECEFPEPCNSEDALFYHFIDKAYVNHKYSKDMLGCCRFQSENGHLFKNEVSIVFVPPVYLNQPCIDVYDIVGSRRKKRLIGKYVLFVGLPQNLSLEDMKAYASILQYLKESAENVREFMKNPHEIMREIIVDEMRTIDSN